MGKSINIANGSKLILGFMVVAALCLAGCKSAEQKPAAVAKTADGVVSFNAPEAWDEFEQTLRLFYAYLERGDFDVEAQLARSKALASAAKTDAEFRRILHRTAYAFTDPHFIVGPFDDFDYNIIPTSSDLKVEWQDDRLVIIGLRHGSAASEKLKAGWFIIDVDGDDPDTASRRPFGKAVKTPTAKQLNYGANLAVNGRRAGEREISVMTHQGTVKDFILPSPRDFALKVNQMPLITTNPFGYSGARFLNGGPDDPLGFFSDGQGRFGYIKINNHLGNNDLITAFDEALKAQMKTEGLVLDLRNTPSGGNTEVARSIIGHFIDETRSYQIHEVPSLEREFTVPRRFIEQVKPRLPYYDKPVVVLGGHWTGSMGEGLVIGMDAAAGAYTITSDMGDLLGALRNFNMKKSTARVDFGSEALFHVDGTPREDYVADLVVPFSGKTKYKSPILAATAYLEAQAR